MKHKDITIFYMVKKASDTPDMEKIIQLVMAYVQNNPIYFQSEPTFVNNIIMFGIVGYETDHNKLQKYLGSDLEKLGGNLSILIKKS
jgi:hypothetical protein